MFYQEDFPQLGELNQPTKSIINTDNTNFIGSRNMIPADDAQLSVGIVLNRRIKNELIIINLHINHP